MKTTNKIALPGSYKKKHTAEKTGVLDHTDIIDITVRIRRKKSLETQLKSGERYTHANYEKQFGSSKKDAARVEAFAQQFHLSIVDVDLARRSVILRGTIENMEAAFGTKLDSSTDEQGKPIRIREGEIFIPASLKDIIEGVFGLDNRPVARPMFKISKRDGPAVLPAAKPQGFNPNDLANIYGFPKDFDGSGETIAILELGGGFRTTDLANYFKGLGIKNPAVKAVAVDGGLNNPTTSNSSDGEVMLDIEVAGAVAPGANIVVYFAPNTDQGFLDGVTTAIHDTGNKPSILSISWGGPEANWTEQSMTGFNEAFKAASLLGVTICVAAGDQGSSDGLDNGQVNVDFPASSPYVLACGGTSLKVNNNAIVSETVWNDSDTSAGGGGVSGFFALPDYQANANVPTVPITKFVGRGVPDVAGDADPDTGYNVLVDGQKLLIGGTSAVAPLYAGLIARVNQQKGKTAGFINPALYANPSLCRDITEGNNTTTASATGYEAGPGWDACTGWGVLSGL
jgi:kumamolisin